MPNWVNGKRDEHLWKKAEKIVQKQYNKTEADGDEYWQLVAGVYKKSGGEVAKPTTKESMGNILNALKEINTTSLI